jgi:hypothetical protein
MIINQSWRIVTKFATPDRPLGQFLIWNGSQGFIYRCGKTISLQSGIIPDGYYQGCLAWFIVVDGALTTEWVITNEPIIVDPTNAANCINTSFPHDCINGACFPKSQFNTPGLYDSLAECEAACGTGCSGKCISNKDWSKIQWLSSQLKNRNCSQ